MPELHTMIRFLFGLFLTGNCFTLKCDLQSLLSHFILLMCQPLLTAGISLGVQVRQSPSAAIRNAGDDVQLICTHEKTDYRVMLWYQQSPGDTALKLIGYVDYSTIKYEGDFEKYCNITGDLSGNTAKRGSLFIAGLKESEHSAVYYCAARYAH